MIAFFARHPVAANLILLAGLFLGLMTFSGMERESFPEFSSSQVSVTVAYPGSTAEDVDEEICLVLDDTLQAITDLDELSCQSVSGSAVATLSMIESGDIAQFFNDIFSEVSAVQDFPADAEEPAVAIAARTEQIALVAVGGLASDEALVLYADTLSAELASLPGVASATVRGISTLEYLIRIDETALRRYGLSPKDVADAISARSIASPLGTVETAGMNFSLRLDDVRRSVPELNTLAIVETSDGGLVRLSDIAAVSLSLADPDDRSELNGDAVAIIALSKAKADDALDAFTAVNEFVGDVNARHGGNLRLSIINNSTQTISDQITLVVENAVQSLVLVFVTMCLFFSFREAFWISLALPFSFLLGLFAMNAVGVTINMMSLLALLMSIGIIMDDSIVIAENIDKWRAELPPQDAAIKGTQEVMSGVISSFLTTAGVFGPLMFLSGEIGAVLQVVPIVLLITLTASLIEAFLILPNHLSHSGANPREQKKRLVSRMLEYFNEHGVVPLTTILTRWRYLSLGCVFAVLVLTVGLITSGTVRVVGFPETEADTIVARVALTPGLQVTHTQAATSKIVAAVERLDAELAPDTEAGAPLVERILVEYGRNADVSNNGPHTATVTVDLLSSDERNVSSAVLLAAWREEAGAIPDVSQLNFTTSSASPGGSDIETSLFSQDLDQLHAASAILLDRLAARDDVRSVYSDFTFGQTEIELKLNAFGRSLGLTSDALAGQLRTSFSGTETDSFSEGETVYGIKVEQTDVASTLGDLEAFPITLSDGAQVPLLRVATIVESASFAQITRENNRARARIVGELDRAVQTANGISTIITDEYAPEIAALYPDVVVTIGGAADEQAETQASILSAFAIGLVLVYIVLAFQFRSYVLPLFILISIPFALIGVVLGHFALGMDISMPSLIGFASLSGVVVNNAILFVTFFEKHAVETHYAKAAVEAVRARFRPVVLSSFTTFIGLLPVVFETSPSIATIVPVVVSVAFGVLSSVFLVILVFPAVMSIYFDFANLDRWLGQNAGVPFDKAIS